MLWYPKIICRPHFLFIIDITYVTFSVIGQVMNVLANDGRGYLCNISCHTPDDFAKTLNPEGRLSPNTVKPLI